MPKGVYVRVKRPLAERFWKQVDRENGPIPDDSSLGRCYIWTGSERFNGRGGMSVDGRLRLAHAVAYILDTGHEPPVETPVLSHLCDNGHLGCVRSSYLEATTQLMNMRRRALRRSGGLSVTTIARQLVEYVDGCANDIDPGQILDHVSRLRDALKRL